jgi:CheY-like chemotaxis protein
MRNHKSAIRPLESTIRPLEFTMSALTADPLPVPEVPVPTGLLLSRDLIFTSKITGTARELGCRVLVAGNVSLARAMIEQHRPRVILVDLAAGDMVSPETLVAYQQLAGPETQLVAFGSHVDTESLAAARAAGCVEVMPRSKFSAELPALIRRLLG